eukprot:IDg11149t1
MSSNVPLLLCVSSAAIDNIQAVSPTLAVPSASEAEAPARHKLTTTSSDRVQESELPANISEADDARVKSSPNRAVSVADVSVEIIQKKAISISNYCICIASSPIKRVKIEGLPTRVVTANLGQQGCEDCPPHVNGEVDGASGSFV